MVRKPEFVRELDPEEAQRLVRESRTAKDRVRLRRAGMVLASLQGRSAPEIAMMFAAKVNALTGGRFDALGQVRAHFRHGFRE
jgi:hypothetical protein